MNTSKSAMSIRLGDPQIKTPDDLPDHFQHRVRSPFVLTIPQSIFNKFDLEIDHVKLGNFTESDKRKVMENFMSNDELLFFVYGLLFPQSVMTMQNSLS
jgi:hypothetical protein